jgi:hypothetical protein
MALHLMHYGKEVCSEILLRELTAKGFTQQQHDTGTYWVIERDKNEIKDFTLY